MIWAIAIAALCVGALFLWLILWTLSAATKRKVTLYCDYYSSLDGSKLRRDIRNYPFFQAEKRFVSMRTFLNWAYGAGGFVYLVMLLVHGRNSLLLYDAGRTTEAIDSAPQLLYYFIFITFFIIKYLLVKREVDEFHIWLDPRSS